MPDYKKMYTIMARETEKAISILIAAQQQCEEIYLNEPEPQIRLLHPEPEPAEPYQHL